MSTSPPTWNEALVAAGFVDPRNGRPSLNQLAIRAGIPVSTVAAIAGNRRTPQPATLARIADALGLDVRVVSEWVGQKRTERDPYTPPAEADLLTDRQRRAVDEIIRSIAAERRGRASDSSPATRGARDAVRRLPRAADTADSDGESAVS